MSWQAILQVDLWKAEVARAVDTTSAGGQPNKSGGDRSNDGTKLGADSTEQGSELIGKPTLWQGGSKETILLCHHCFYTEPSSGNFSGGQGPITPASNDHLTACHEDSAQHSANKVVWTTLT